MAFTSIDPAVVALSAALAMLMTGCVSKGSLRSGIQWQVIVVIGCALAIGEALLSSGAVRYLAQDVLGALGRAGIGAHGTLFFIFVLTSLAAQVITNNGAGVLVVPIAMEAARGLGCSPEPFLFVLMLAAGACFMSPIYQTNLIDLRAGRVSISGLRPFRASVDRSGWRCRYTHRAGRVPFSARPLGQSWGDLLW